MCIFVSEVQTENSQNYRRVIMSHHASSAFHISARSWALLAISQELNVPRHIAQGGFATIANSATQVYRIIKKEEKGSLMDIKGFLMDRREPSPSSSPSLSCHYTFCDLFCALQKSNYGTRFFIFYFH